MIQIPSPVYIKHPNGMVPDICVEITKPWFRFGGVSYPIGSMVLAYLTTKLGHKNAINVSTYASTMDHPGIRGYCITRYLRAKSVNNLSPVRLTKAMVSAKKNKRRFFEDVPWQVRNMIGLEMNGFRIPAKEVYKVRPQFVNAK